MHTKAVAVVAVALVAAAPTLSEGASVKRGEDAPASRRAMGTGRSRTTIHAGPGRGRRLLGVLGAPHRTLRRRGPAEDLGATSGSSLGWPIFACWAYFVSVALTAPAMPSFCNSVANPDGSKTVSPAGVDLKGTFESVDQLMTFIFDPFWGAVSDHVGRKPLQVLACAGITLGWGTVALSRTVPLLVAGRALDGITSCMLPICQSSVKDVSPAARLASNLGLLQGVAVGLAFIIGGIAGGVLSNSVPPQKVFSIAAAVALIAAILIAALGPETLPPGRRAPRVDWTRANALSAIVRLGSSSQTLGASGAFLCFWLGLNGLQVNMYNYLSYRFGWPPSSSVGLQALSGVVLAVSNVVGPRLLIPVIGENGVMRAGLLGLSASLAAMAVTGSSLVFVLAVIGASVATMCLPGLTGLIAMQAEPGQAGAMLTALDSVSTLDRLLAYKLMSRLFAWGIGHQRPTVHFQVGACFVLLGLGCFERMVARPARGQPAAVKGGASA